MNDINEFLNSETVDKLKIRLKTLSGFKKQPTMRKSQLISNIELFYTVPNLQNKWEQISKIDKLAIAEYIYNYSLEELFDYESFYAKYQQNPDFYSEDRFGTRKTKSESFTGAYFFKYGYEMPYELQKRFMTFVDEPKGIKANTTENLPEINGLTVKKTEDTAIFELKTILKLIDNSKLKASAITKIPSITAIKSIDAILPGGDFYPEHEVWAEKRAFAEDIGYIRAYGWLMLLQAGGLVKINGSTMILTAKGKRVLEKEHPHKTIKTLWERWLKTKILDEFRRIDEIKGQTGKAKRNFTKTEVRRSSINIALKSIEPGKWINFDEFSRLIKSDKDLKFSVTKGDPWDLYICEKGYGSLGYDGYHEWNILEERYILCLLFEYAATLGLIDIAYSSPIDAKPDFGDIWGTDGMYFLSRYDGLKYIRINSLGDYCFGNSDEYTYSKEETENIDIKIDNKGLITLNAILPPHDLLTILDRFTLKKSNNSWQILRSSLMNAIEKGNSVSEFTDFLYKYNINLSLKLKEQINDIEQKSDSIKIKDKVIVYQLKTIKLKGELVNDSKIGGMCMDIGTNLLGVSETNNKNFLTEIRKRGYPVCEKH